MIDGILNDTTTLIKKEHGGNYKEEEIHILHILKCGTIPTSMFGVIPRTHLFFFFLFFFVRKYLFARNTISVLIPSLSSDIRNKSLTSNQDFFAKT